MVFGPLDGRWIRKKNIEVDSKSHLLGLSMINRVIIVLYFVVVLAIGFYLKRFTSTGEDFFMAGCRMPACGRAALDISRASGHAITTVAGMDRYHAQLQQEIYSMQTGD